MKTFAGQNAVITGAAAGIGAAIAKALCERGARVLLGDVEVDKAERIAASLREEGHAAHAHFVDVSQRESVEALARHAFALFGAVHLLFNNAGVGIGGSLEKVKPGAFQWVFGVNVTGVYHGAAAFAPHMLAHGAPARIINTASEHAVGLPPRGGQVTTYTATKHAVLGMSDAMRRDYAGTNLSVSVICPGLVQSEIWNTLRNRPDYAGGPRQSDPKYGAENQTGLPAAIAAARILDQIEDGAFLVFTHGRDVRAIADARALEMTRALDAFAARYGDDA
jgi:NAD(P)-dependent dehydrogenase (short-subunit alcohol dehydrogenase family)